MSAWKNIKWKNYANYIVLAAVTVLFAVLSFSGVLKSSDVYLLEKIAIAIMLAVSLSMVVGFLGELSLGHAGFMCVGADIMYSGTVGAVCEAANLGVKAIAFSTSPAYYDRAVTHLDRIYAYIMEHKLLDLCDIYNVNIPDDPGTIRITHQGGPYYSDEFTLENGMVTPHGIDVFEACDDDTVDTDCVLRCGNISIMPLALHRTDYAIFQKLSPLNN